MSTSAQQTSPRLFPHGGDCSIDVEPDKDAGLFPTTITSTVVEDSRLLAERIWQAVTQDVQLASHPESAGHGD